MPSMPARAPAPDPRSGRAQTRTLAAEAKTAVLAWYATTGRRLAFRGTTDPYAILVSETMAQQTQAARAAEAWRTFLAEFPTVEVLAAASPAAVLRAWRGLGYNRRALALQTAARKIVGEHGGRVPSELRALEALPGIGPYTARAVLAIAFGRAVGPVDTNVRRVLGRALAGDPSSVSIRAMQQLADDAVIEVADPGTWSHALMDMGARVCRPRAPDCPNCPLAAWCAYAADRPAQAQGGFDVADRAPATRRIRGSSASVRFPASTRWLRGRILDRLRDIEDGAWHEFEEPIGGHDLAAIHRSLKALERDGLVELRELTPLEARLPVA